MKDIMKFDIPDNLEERNVNEQSVYRFLRENEIPFLRIDHQAMVDMESYMKIEKEYSICIPKNLFLCNRQQTKFYLLLMRGDKKFLTKDISKQINSARLSFGNEEKLNEMLHCFHGSTSPFGLIFDKDNQVSVLIDNDLLSHEKLGFHPCMNTSTLIIDKGDLIGGFLKRVNHEPIFVNLPKENDPE